MGFGFTGLGANGRVWRLGLGRSEVLRNGTKDLGFAETWRFEDLALFVVLV